MRRLTAWVGLGCGLVLLLFFYRSVLFQGHQFAFLDRKAHAVDGRHFTELFAYILEFDTHARVRDSVSVISGTACWARSKSFSVFHSTIVLIPSVINASMASRLATAKAAGMPCAA